MEDIADEGNQHKLKLYQTNSKSNHEIIPLNNEKDDISKGHASRSRKTVNHQDSTWASDVRNSGSSSRLAQPEDSDSSPETRPKVEYFDATTEKSIKAASKRLMNEVTVVFGTNERKSPKKGKSGKKCEDEDVLEVLREVVRKCTTNEPPKSPSAQDMYNLLSSCL